MPTATTRARTQYYTASTLDGFIAGPGHDLEWLFQFGEAGNDDFPAFIAEVGAAVMGSSTYEWVLRHLGLPDGEDPQPWPYELPTWVFTTRELPAVEGADVRFVRGDVVPVHEAMVRAADGRNVWVVGGGELAGQFLDHGLLDELIVTVASCTLGEGHPLLPRRVSRPPLRLVSVRQIGPGFVQLRYEVPRPG